MVSRPLKKSSSLRSAAKSIRLTPLEQARLEQAAHCSGLSASAFMRDSIMKRCDELLAEKPSLLSQISDLVGISDEPSDVARKTGKAFSELLIHNSSKKRRTL